MLCRNWAFFSGQLPLMTVQDTTLSQYCEPRKRGTWQNQSMEGIEEQVLTAAEELQEFIGRILKISVAADNEPHYQKSSLYSSTADLNRRITTWNQNLPQILQWTSVNFATAPLAFFLLQYADPSHSYPVVCFQTFVWS